MDVHSSRKSRHHSNSENGLDPAEENFSPFSRHESHLEETSALAAGLGKKLLKAINEARISDSHNRWDIVQEALLDIVHAVEGMSNRLVVSVLNTPEPSTLRTPIHLLSRYSAPLALIKTALMHGADPHALDRYHHNALSSLLVAEKPSVHVLNELRRHGTRLPDDCAEVVFHEIRHMLEHQDWRRAGFALRLLKSALAAGQHDLVEEALNYPAYRGLKGSKAGSEEPASVLELAWRSEAPLPLLRRAAFICNDVDYPHPITGQTLLHQAVHLLDLSFVKVLLEAGADPNASDRNNNSPLDALLKAFTYWSDKDLPQNFIPLANETAQLLIDSGARIGSPDGKAPQALLEVLSSFNMEKLRLLLQIYENPALSMSHGYSAEELKNLREVADMCEHTAPPEHGTLSYDMGSMLFQYNRPEHLVKYLEAYRDHRDFISGDPEKAAAALRGTSLTAILPQLMLNYSPETITNLVNEIDLSIDDLDEATVCHPYEAELFALLNNRSELDSLGEHVQNIVYALTSLIKLRAGTDGKLSALAAQNMADIGVLSFSFQKLKFDTQRPVYMVAGEELRGSSLLQQFGFRPLRGDRMDELYGKGFEFTPAPDDLAAYHRPAQDKNEVRLLTPGLYMEFRRTFMRVVFPEGDLIIRNSSPEGGRHKLLHTAYWADSPRYKPVSEEIDNHTHRARYTYLLNMYARMEPPKWGDFDRRVASALKLLQGVLQKYSAWKCDTGYDTAWGEIDGIGVYPRGAYLSPGFKPLVDFVEHAWQARNAGKDVVVPDLAFVDKRFPPWAAHKFDDGRGEMTERFTPTLERLQALRLLCDFHLTDEIWQCTGLRHFLQTGMNYEAELVLLDPLSEE